MHEESFQPLDFRRYGEDEMRERAKSFYEHMNRRRTVRAFSSDPIPDEVIDHILLTASTAPSGAHKQPWFFAVIKSAEMKARIREAAEKEERENYERRMSQAWLDDLAKFGTDAVKPHIEDAPAIIVVFKQNYRVVDGEKQKNYYVNESVGLATGLLIAAIHNAGLATLTHTPSPMGFLNEILERPKNETPILLMPIGYPADDCQVPVLTRKGLDEVARSY